MQKHSILLVEDEEHLHEALKLNLEMDGYQVDSAFDGGEALKKIQSAHYDLLILDIMLPSLDGFSITEQMRLNNNQTPILILSAKNTSANKVQGLKLGADDYLTKPFNLEELLLRVAKLIQKQVQQVHASPQIDRYQFNGHHIDFNASEAILASGKKITLTKRELLLLKLLIDHKHHVVTREKILQLVWGYQVFPNTRTIDNFILNFRKYFEIDPKHPKHFISMRGVGYKFQD
ncbi:MAG: response regulator transcription factor [Chitinophagia bacterium]|jgi:two-component system alkaline phosphatase synthesis response regulator PhoP